MFELNKEFGLLNFTIEYIIPLPNNTSITETSVISGYYTIHSLQNQLQKNVNNIYNSVIEKFIKEKKNDITDKLKATPLTRLKFEMEKINNNHYAMILNLPLKAKILKLGNFCFFFKFDNCQDIILMPDKTYISENIISLFKPFSMIEWHCNIVEYSYANHDSHPHLHKHDVLLHISFIDNNFYDNAVYKETCTKIMFIPLRKGMQKIREIILTPIVEINKNDKIDKNILSKIKNGTVYLQLKEE